jgi:hypothetical protein
LVGTISHPHGVDVPSNDERQLFIPKSALLYPHI